MPVEPVKPLRDPAGPSRVVDDDAPLFTWLQIAVAALLGTPITAGLLWSANARALGWRRPWASVVVGAVATLLPFALAIGLRFELTALSILVMWPLLAAAAAGRAFGEIAPHRRRSNAGVVVAVVVVIAVLVNAETLLKVRGAVVPRPEGHSVSVAGVRVIPVAGVSDDDAAHAAQVLHDAGFARQGPLSLRLGRDVDGFAARLRVPAPVNDELVASARALTAALAKGLGACVTMTLVRAEDDQRLASGRSCPR